MQHKLEAILFICLIVPLVGLGIYAMSSYSAEQGEQAARKSVLQQVANAVTPTKDTTVVFKQQYTDAEVICELALGEQTFSNAIKRSAEDETPAGDEQEKNLLQVQIGTKISSVSYRKGTEVHFTVKNKHGEQASYIYNTETHKLTRT